VIHRRSSYKFTNTTSLVAIKRFLKDTLISDLLKSLMDNQLRLRDQKESKLSLITLKFSQGSPSWIMSSVAARSEST